MADSERFEMRLSVQLLGRLDEARGNVPRATYVKAALVQKLDLMLEPRVVMQAPSPPASLGGGRPDRVREGTPRPVPGVVKASSLVRRPLLDVVAYGPPSISAARARIRLSEGRVLVAGEVVKDGSLMVDPSEVRQLQA